MWCCCAPLRPWLVGWTGSGAGVLEHGAEAPHFVRGWWGGPEVGLERLSMVLRHPTSSVVGGVDRKWGWRA